MGRSTKIDQTQRAQVNPKDTFDITTPQLDVVARPTDPMVEAYHDPSGAQFMGVIKDINSGLTTYSDIQEVQKPLNKAQAAADYANQKTYNKPSGIFNLGAGYDETWGHLDGEARAQEFKAEFDRLHQEAGYYKDLPNREQAAAARQNLYNETYQKFFGNEQNPYTITGAYPIIEATKIAANKEGEVIFAEQRVAQLKTNVGSIQKGIILTGIDQGWTPEETNKKLDEFFASVKPSIGLVMTRDEFAALRINNTFGLVDDMIKGATDKEGKLITPIDSIETKAANLIAALKAKPQDNVPLGDIVSVDKEGNATYKFRAAIHAGEQAVLTQLKALRQGAKDQTANGYILELANVQNVNDALALKTKLSDPTVQGQLDNGVYNMLLTHTQTIIDNGGKKRTTSDPVVYPHMMELALSKKLTLRDIAANLKYLTEADQKYFHSIVDGDLKFNIQMSKQEQRYDQMAFTDLKNSLFTMYAQDPLGRFTAEKMMATKQLWDEARQFQKTHNDQWPVGDDFDKIRKNVMRDHELAFIGDGSGAAKGTTPAAAPQQKKPAVAGAPTNKTKPAPSPGAVIYRLNHATGQVEAVTNDMPEFGGY